MSDFASDQVCTPVREPDKATAALSASGEESAGPTHGIALCLSGGGYRAMIFHLGVVWRLNEAGALRKLARVSSVSGGSITAAVLGMNWSALGFGPSGVANAFQSMVVEPVRSMADQTVDEWSILRGIFLPGTIADKVTAAYAKALFGSKTLQDLPSDAEGPRFVINATNVQTGALFRFSRPYLADWRVGMVKNPTTSLATAVAASSAFPPVLSPLTLKLDPATVLPLQGADLNTSDPAFRASPTLSDGGVYDNLGLETAFKHYTTLLVSDAGQKMNPEPKPAGDWARHSVRIMNLLDNQVRTLRKRQLIGAFEATAGSDQRRDGAYWAIRSQFADFANGASPPLTDPLSLLTYDPSALAGIPTRLKQLPAAVQEKLINWGYAICDTGLRRHAAPALSAFGISIAMPLGLPYPAAGL